MLLETYAAGCYSGVLVMTLGVFIGLCVCSLVNWLVGQLLGGWRGGNNPPTLLSAFSAVV